LNLRKKLKIVIIMKTHLLSPAIAATLLLGTAHADPPKSSHVPPPKVRHAPWTLKRLAMQPLRLIVMAAKVPLIPAGIVATAGVVASENAAGRPMDFPDFGPAFANFDPGPAIDADLERSASRRSQKDDRAPAPMKSELKISRSTAATSARSSPSGGAVALNP
jgi:hypothetical protein